MDEDADRLDLDSPRWRELSTRMGPDTYPLGGVLRTLIEDPSDLDLFREMWPEICSEGTTYEAAYAAAPYLVDFAERLKTPESNEYLIVAGLITTCASGAPPDLERSYRMAVQRALTLVLQHLADCKTDHDLRYLMAAVAAFRGRGDLASVLQDLDTVQQNCPTCGTVVYPSELQAVTERDSASR